MNPINNDLRKEISDDSYYKTCCITGKQNVKIDWHHVWIYAGKQINEKWAIMPIWEMKHSPMGDNDSVHRCKETRELVQYLSLKRATDDDLEKYPNKNWKLIFKNLKEKYEGIR